jgi:anti-sigma regulatory factor (Ser/Thr protein kinase)
LSAVAAGDGDGDLSPRTVRVADGLDVFVARWAAQRLARAIGFGGAACHEIAIVASELATNIVKYGVRGRILVQPVRDPERGIGIELVADDEGPLLADLATALQDGCGDAGPIDPAQQLGRGGIGGGLGAIRRLTDVFEYRASASTKAFRAVRYLERSRHRIGR